MTLSEWHGLLRDDESDGLPIIDMRRNASGIWTASAELFSGGSFSYCSSDGSSFLGVDLASGPDVLIIDSMTGFGEILMRHGVPIMRPGHEYGVTTKGS